MVKETDKPVIDRLFYVMREQYGSYWVILIGDEPIVDVKAKWLKRLNRYSRKDIGKAVDNVKKIYPKRPPDLDQFAALIRQLKGHRPGHQSDVLWPSKPMEKTKSSGFRDKIREESGI